MSRGARLEPRLRDSDAVEGCPGLLCHRAHDTGVLPCRGEFETR